MCEYEFRYEGIVLKNPQKSSILNDYGHSPERKYDRFLASKDANMPIKLQDAHFSQHEPLKIKGCSRIELNILKAFGYNIV